MYKYINFFKYCNTALEYLKKYFKYSKALRSLSTGNFKYLGACYFKMFFAQLYCTNFTYINFHRYKRGESLPFGRCRM